jgi:D-amino peptidase
MRIYISADIEGVAGVVSLHQLVPGEFEYEQARDWMTAEVNAACRAAIEAGATEIVISDSHGNGENIKIEKLPSQARLVRSWPRPLLMMQGIERGRFDAAAFIGYHAGGHAGRGVLAHTMSSGKIRSIAINGELVSEFDISFLVAAHFGVPVIMASGDDALAETVTQQYGGIAFATTKWTDGTVWAESLTPDNACAEIARKMTEGLRNIGKVTPPPAPTVVEIDFTRRLIAEVFSYLPGIERTGAFSIRSELPDMVAASRFLSFALFGLNPFNS